MDILKPYLIIGKEYLDCGIKQSEAIFNQYIEYVDFTAFCIVYTIVLVWILKKINRPAIFRPKNRELIDWKERVKKGISTFIVSLPIIKQYVDNKFQKGLVDIEGDIIKDFQKSRDSTKSKRLPEQGMKETNIQNRIQKWFGVQRDRMFSGKNSGSIYPENNQFCREVSDFASKYMYHNPLHLDTYKQVGKMQAEVIRMTCSLVSKNPAYGVITSGGSESLIMSLYAYRKFYNKSKPNIVVPNSIHAAIDKGAHYFNIEVRKAKLNDMYEVDMKDMASLIDSNTIALYASYANYPHGIIDPIAQVAALAKKHKIGFHVDGCLGGFIAAFLKDHQGKFSLDIDGVTSISLDHHKFALAPKGASCIIYKNKEMRQQMYYINTDWVGAIYATPSFPGSRSGFASAGAWYCLTHVGRKQFLDNALKIVDATKTAAEGLSKIEGVKVIGRPELCALAFQIVTVDCFTVSAYLSKEKNWKISSLHIPKALHVSVTPSNCQSVKKNLAADVKQAIQKVKEQPQKQTSTAAFYGASAALPSQAMGEQLLRKFMSITYK